MLPLYVMCIERPQRPIWNNLVHCRPLFWAWFQLVLLPKMQHSRIFVNVFFPPFRNPRLLKRWRLFTETCSYLCHSEVEQVSLDETFATLSNILLPCILWISLFLHRFHYNLEVARHLFSPLCCTVYCQASQDRWLSFSFLCYSFKI